MGRILKHIALMAILTCIPLLVGAENGNVMRLSLKDGKIVAEIPQSCLGKRYLMASVIEETSDPGEGVAGQMSDNCIPMTFNLDDSALIVRVPIERPLLYETDDEQLKDLVEKSTLEGDWKRYKVKSVKPDGTVVADLTDLFKEHNSKLYTFPLYSHNSMNGQVMRVHAPIADKSRFTDAGESDDISYVLCDFYYNMEGYVMGMMKIAGDYSFRARIRKMLFMPREYGAFPELKHDPRVGVNTVQRSVIPSSSSPVRTVRSAVRWRIEPSDSSAWNKGEVVPVKRPIVYHMDPLIPSEWRKYVREGVLAWNKAFESAGLSDVLEIRELSEDTISFAASPYISRIIFAPSGMQEAEVSSLTDGETGEIFSSCICLHADVMAKWAASLMMYTAGADPRVRTADLPDEISGQLIRLMTMQAVGKSLGLRENAVASLAYPLDSLRSPSFTAEYGLTASVMETPVFNYVAQPEDVQAGVSMIQSVTGPYDRFAIGWLYGPDYMRAPERMKVAESDPNLRYHSLPERFDPKVHRGDLGDDPFLSLNYWTLNQKRLFANAVEWFASEDPGQDMLIKLLQDVEDRHTRFIVQLVKFAGGYASDGVGGYVPLPSSLQSKAVKEAISYLRDMEWTRCLPAGRLPYGSIEFEGDVHSTNVFNSLLERIDKVRECSASALQDPYTEAAFLADIRNEIFGTKEALSKLTSIEMVWQDAFISLLLERYKVSAAAGACLRNLRPLIYNASLRTSGEDRDHYVYLLFRVDRGLKDDN